MKMNRMLCVLVLIVVILLGKRLQPSADPAALTRPVLPNGANLRVRQPAAATPAHFQPAARTQVKNAPYRSRYDLNDPNAPKFKQYFYSMLLAKPRVAFVFDNLMDALPDSSSKELIAMYIARSLVLGEGGGFSQFMMGLQLAMNADPQQTYLDLLSALPTLKQDAYAFEFALNMGYNLNISNEQLVTILGQGAAMPFAFGLDGHMTFMSGNIAIAFALMKNAGVSPDLVEPYVEAGLEQNQGNAQATQEYLNRVRPYYPTLAQQ